MKKHCIALLSLLLMAVCSLTASPVYKSFTVNGETVNRWVNVLITEYDTKGNKIHYKKSDGYESWDEYDTDGHKIHYKNSDGNEEWYEYEFYPSGKVSKKIEYRRF